MIWSSVFFIPIPVVVSFLFSVSQVSKSSEKGIRKCFWCEYFWEHFIIYIYIYNRWVDFDLPMTFANINFANRMCAKTTIVTRSFFGKLTFPVGGQFDYPFLIFLYTSGIETNKCLMLPAYINNFSHANKALINSSAIQLILFLLKHK